MKEENRKLEEEMEEIQKYLILNGHSQELKKNKDWTF